MGDNLRRLRSKYDISQEKLCAELQRRGCDIGRSTYAKYEAGELNIRASVLIENADLESLKPSESIKLHTKLDGGKLLVELLVDDKVVNVPMRVLTWSKGDKEYVGNSDSELGWGIDEGVKYITAFSSLNGSGELEVSDLSAKPEGWGWLRYKTLWKLRLGDKFQY